LIDAIEETDSERSVSDNYSR